MLWPVMEMLHFIGMALLANLTAHDFGYITHATLLRRTAATLETLKRLPRHRGHFYNWYDTLSLEPLSPRYVSSVDSGNLMACLLVLASALEHTDEDALVSVKLAHGLRDTARVLGDCLPGVDAADPHANLALAATLTELDGLVADAVGNAHPANCPVWWDAKVT